MSQKIINLLSFALLFAAINCFSAQGLTVFHVGNSLTDETYGMHTIAGGFGYTWPGGIVYGRSMIPGCPLWLLWSDNVKKTANKAEGNVGFFLEATHLGAWGERWIEEYHPTLWSTTLYLKATPFDALVIQGGGDRQQGTYDGAIGYSGNAYTSNPNCQVYLYPGHTMTVGDTNNLKDLTDFYEPCAKIVTNAYPTRKPTLILPVWQAWNEMMRAGYKDLWIGGVKNDGHANDMGKYILSVTIYTCLYKKNPAGAIDSSGSFHVSAAFAAKAQEIAWKVANSYPMSGVGSTDVAKPVNVRSTPAVSATRARIVDLAGRQVSKGTSTLKGLTPGLHAVTVEHNGVNVSKTMIVR